MITESSFLKDVASHKLEIVKDDGLYRHLEFYAPGTRNMSFELITWPGYLCYTGDMGSYVFCRSRDMFEFFRTDRDYATRKGLQLTINPRYWAEKLEAQDKTDGVTEFSEERFNRAVLGDLVTWIREYANETSKEERRLLWDAVVSDVIRAAGDDGGYRKRCAAHDFSHFVNAQVGGFYFQDFVEHTVTNYTFRYQWCCYAIAWGVMQYDRAKAATDSASLTA